MAKFLIIYANSAPVKRKSVEAMLYSFRDNLPGCDVFYHNGIFNRAPILSVYRDVDYVIFHHSVTTVWNRPRYRKKIRAWLSYDFGAAKKIALMQDEYKNVDLLREFITELSLDRVFTLAQPSEWALIYGQEIANSGILTQYLAGYIEGGDSNSSLHIVRDIDIGYRTDWTKMHVKLGRTGLLKRDIASKVEARALARGLVTDIKVGERHFISGDEWSVFLKRCRFVIGVPSGSSVLDGDGSIERLLTEKLLENPYVEEQEMFDGIVSPFEGSLALEVLSPRHFEAMHNGCGQILVESEYNGVLEPWVHYFPLKRDFSNLDELLDLTLDESLRLEMVRNCKRDILDPGDFEYRHFVDLVLPEFADLNLKPIETSIWLSLNRWIEQFKNLVVQSYRKLL